jgi:hypothetical protein
MTNFFIDIWHDLREKRLWPAAVGLLAAIVAVPVVLFKPASDAAPPSAATPKGGQTAALPLVHVDSGPAMGSHLEAFSASEKNPFKPMKDLAKTPVTSTQSAPQATPGGTPAANPKSTTGGGGGGGGTPGGASPSPGGGTPNKGNSPGPSTRWFHYVADFSFGETGKKAKTYKGRASYTLLPDEQKPAVVFLGLSADHKSALFFIDDPGFDAQGEGTCNTTTACQFVTLTLSDSGDEETFSAADGSVSYDLQLLAIRRESLGTGSQPTTPVTPKNGKTLSAAGAGVAAATDTAQNLVPGTFADGPGVALQTK